MGEEDEEISLVCRQLFAWSQPVATVGKETRHQVAFRLFLFFIIRKVHLASPQTAPLTATMENHQSSLSWFVWVNGCQGK